MSRTSSTPAAPEKREGFSSRRVFIFAAIGSAIGLGNIWRFPYVAYDNGGGAFIIPYLVALLTAGIPLLFFDYAVGHRHRASAPLSFRRIHPKLEFLGWWQLAICFVIAAYYAVILAWAVMYTGFSFTRAWGSDPAAYFQETFTQSTGGSGVGFDFVPQVLIPLLLVWVVLLIVMAFGVQKGIGASNIVFLPLLVVMFIVMVIMALTLPGASTGLDALFTPNWAALGDSGVWVAAYGQIFFSLSVGFGIMITYSSYLKRKTDLTSSGLVVGFSNSSFEILAGIGVFAALGFMAQASGTQVSEVAESGIGLAFIAFPAVINEAPFGTVIGVLFFGALSFAAFTSLISIVEVVIAGAQDKLGLRRVPATLGVGGLIALASLLLFPTTTGLNLLDVVDNFVNNFGIVVVALIAVTLLTAGFNALPRLRDHLNEVSTFKVGRTWQIFVGVVTPLLLGYILIDQISAVIAEGYGDLPREFVNVYGWGMSIGLIVVAVLLSLIPWSSRSRAAEPSPAYAVLDPVMDAKLMRRNGARGEAGHVEAEPGVEREALEGAAAAPWSTESGEGERA
ncbi:sodium-dependent transporter [Rothia halotolerans]|uniref:sodium-dependent transporter n=1 Tax=Rothia halotolerans TaxID=405770 RepID=UPI00101CEF64|nr:sodium-dependent transporter [Rothia halotolerans]